MPTIPFLPTQLYAVIGYPLNQTLSPLLHNIGFQAHHLTATYHAFPIAEKDLAAFVQAVRLLQIQGCSVTIPHKEKILPLLDGLTARASRIGAVNTLFWQNGKLLGDNTDIAGFLAPLQETNLSGMRVLLLGAGGACRAALCGLTERNVQEIYVATPSNTRAQSLAEEFSCTPIPWQSREEHSVDMVINATPLGMHGTYVEQTPYTFTKKHLPSLAYDIVYNPLKTRFLREAHAHGVQTIAGLEMFFAQADAQFTLWTSTHLPNAARLALVEALDATNTQKRLSV